MEITKQTEKRNLKRILIAIASVLVGLFLLLGVLRLVSELLKGDKIDYTDKTEGIYFFSADPDEDPMEDLVYLSKNRDIMFTDHTGNGELLTEQDSDSKNPRALMYNYFTALLNGDAEAHKNLLTTEYKSNFVVQESFTPQKVYDINIRFLTGDTDGNKYLEKYQVSYKIYENNGTYRGDVGSDTAKLMVFEVANENGKSMINSIVPLNSK